MRSLVAITFLMSFPSHSNNIDYWESIFQSSAQARERAHQVQQPIAAPKSSNFGLRFHPILQIDRLHRGVDFAAEEGTPFYAAGAGVVLYAETRGDLGLTIAVRHDNGIVTRYGHASAALVQQGDNVDRHTHIGLVGTTGVSTGPHLHFELIKDGKHINPEDISFYNPNDDHLTLDERINGLLTRQQQTVLQGAPHQQLSDYTNGLFSREHKAKKNNRLATKNKTTWSLANELIAGSRLTVYQSLYAIMDANPSLFPTRDINLRYEGELVLPDIEIIAKQCQVSTKNKFYGVPSEIAAVNLSP